MSHTIYAAKFVNMYFYDGKVSHIYIYDGKVFDKHSLKSV